MKPNSSVRAAAGSPPTKKTSVTPFTLEHSNSHFGGQKNVRRKTVLCWS
jgi:hypothetical protein